MFIQIQRDNGAKGLFHRDHLATAILLRLDSPDDGVPVRDALVNDFGLSRLEALRHTLAAGYCIDHGIDPHGPHHTSH